MHNFLALCMAATLAASAARAHASDLTPYLRVETGMHQAVINRMALLPGDNAIATVSDDKTARIWSVNGLKPLGVIRPPIGPGDDGELVGVAASGNVLALAGRLRYGTDRFGVQFYRLPDLKPVGQLPTLPAPISALRFSRDGRTMLVGMVGGRGLAFFNMRDHAMPVGVDPAYVGQVQWIDVDSQDRAVVSGEDGRIRLYGPDHRKVVEAGLPKGGKPYAVAFSPDGRFVAVGNQNGPQVWLLDAATLRLVRSFMGGPGCTGGFAVVAFTPSGDALFGAGTYKASASASRVVRRWALDGGPAAEFKVGGDTVMDLLPIGRDVLVADAEPAVERLDASGRVLAKQAAHHIDFRDAGLSGFAVSRDGTAIELPLGGSSGRLVFDVRARSLAAAEVNGLATPSAVAGALRASNWRNTPAPRLNNRAVSLERDEMSLAVAVSKAGHGAAFGTNFYIRFQQPGGTGWRTPVAAPAWAVNVSGDGRLVVAGLGDGTARWYDAASGNEILALFLEPATRHWVLSTAEGFFDHDDAGPGESDGRTLIGYSFNDQAAQASRFVEVGQLYPVFYRPDLVGLSLRNDASARRTIEKAHEGRGAVTAVLNRGLPASVELQEICGLPDPGTSDCPAGTRPFDTPSPPQHPGARLATTADTLLVRFRLSNPGSNPGHAAIFRNAAAISPTLLTMKEDEHSRTQEAVIPLGDGENVIQLKPISSSGEVEGSASSSIGFSVWRTPASFMLKSGPQFPQPRRTLFLLSVGVSRFGHHELTLENATNDARAVAGLMATPDPPIYDASDVTTLYDERATAETVTTALRAIAEKAQPDDLVMIFLAGHGQEVDGRFYFAPSDFGMRNPELFARALSPGINGDMALDQLFQTEGLGPDRMLPLIQAIRAARVAIVLDSCYSASLATPDTVLQRDVNRTVTNAIGHATGRFVLSSATTFALDTSAAAGSVTQDGKGHGLFTSYLLQALEGRADVLHVGRVDVVQLAEYTVSKVKQATAGFEEKQEPTFFFSGNDFFAVHTDNSAQ